MVLDPGRTQNHLGAFSTPLPRLSPRAITSEVPGMGAFQVLQSAAKVKNYCFKVRGSIMVIKERFPFAKVRLCVEKKAFVGSENPELRGLRV